MSNNKIIGQNFLHQHIFLHQNCVRSTDKLVSREFQRERLIIVDEEDWESILDYFHRNPEAVSDLRDFPEPEPLSFKQF